jgi:phenylacetate-coenzyme A ligase PaaK-like adenylate-forming protein
MVAASRATAYEPIETASRDEITALQVERLRWSLHQAYMTTSTTTVAGSMPTESTPMT